MADTLRELEKGHEAKFKMDEELRFKALCRRDKLFGLWAAGHMGMTQNQADEYARGLIRLNLESAAPTAVFNKVSADFRDLGVRMSETDILTAQQRCHSTAIQQLRENFPTALDKDHARVGD